MSRFGWVCLLLCACGSPRTDGPGGGSGGNGGTAGGAAAGGSAGSAGSGGQAGGSAGSAAGGSAGSTAGGSAGGAAGGSAGGSSADAGNLLAQRPYRLVVPAGYDGGTAVPFVMLLHGYTATGLQQDAYFRMSELAQARTFILATPDGLVDGLGSHYWNATDYCCGFNTQRTDDVAYLTAILDDVETRFRVDTKRVFFVGHSNGGFMSHRMACDRSNRIAAIVSLAGAQWKMPSLCQPSQPVSVLQVHGDLDATILYPGTAAYPGARETVSTWATLNGCTGAVRDGGVDLDLVPGLLGDETHREEHGGCPATGAAELWTIRGGPHVPIFGLDWAPKIYDFLLAHSRP